MRDSRPIIGFNGRRGSRVEWDEMDAILKGATVSFENVSIARDGLSEQVVRMGYTADGRMFRTREFYGR
jgi:hypothetical protein